jgi:hypothetical protein
LPNLNANLMWCVHRIRTTFRDAIGNRRTGVGTGFWLYVGAHHVFVTNRHNVDPSLKFPAEHDLELLSLEIDLRQWIRGATPETKFFPMEDPTRGVHMSSEADCAILVDPVLSGRDSDVFPSAQIIKPKDLATHQAFAAGIVQPMEPAVFIGFPGAAGQHWWDDRWNMPVARQCVLASVPAIPFTNRDIRTKDTILVSGLSFAGASGSPVFLAPRGLAPGGDINDPDWRPALLIGLMSGHFWEPGVTPEMFRHSGLSYLTRSSSIWELLLAAGLGVPALVPGAV